MTELTGDAHDLATEYAKKCYRGEDVDFELSKRGIELMDIGFGRAVYSFPRQYTRGNDSSTSYIIKLPERSMHRTADGLEQNRREIEAGKTLSKTIETISFRSSITIPTVGGL